MKIIFLDIDGVLNHQKWYKTRMDLKNGTDSKEWSDSYPFYEFDPESIKHLNKIVDLTGAKVVVSSTWRIGRRISDLQEILDRVGFVGEVIDTTPSFFAKGSDNEGGKISYTVPRGCEIDWWLENRGNFMRINWSMERQLERLNEGLVKNYVILDDDSDMLYSQREHFIQTSSMDGLTEELASKAIRILNTPIEKLYKL